MTKEIQQLVQAYRATNRAAFLKHDRAGKLKAIALDGRTMSVADAVAKMRAVLAG